jgi:metabotropic glutamate receptor 6/7/8
MLIVYVLSRTPKKGTEDLSAGYRQEGLVPFVVNAVYALAHAIHTLHAQKCPNSVSICREMLPVAGPDLLRHIRKLNFTG